MKKETKHELFRAFSQLIYWGIIGGLIIILMHLKVIGSATKVNDSVKCFVDERLNMWVYGVELLALIIVAGLVAILGAKEYVSIVREEISRICYTLGSFTCVSFVVLTFYYRNIVGDVSSSHGYFGNYIDAIVSFIIFSFVGFALYLRHSSVDSN